MRCSWCESRLDRFVEGSLSPREMRSVNAHLAACASCQAFIEEVRTVDALLATAAQAELPLNFTFATMAEIRSLPAPAARGFMTWPILSLYLLSTWIALAAALWAARTRTGFAELSLRSDFAHSFAALSGTAHAFAPVTPLLIGSVLAMLAIEAALIGAVVFFYRVVHPHLATQLVRVESPS